MKELTIEEKARRYDGAIKRLEDIETGNCQKTFMFTEGLFDYIFPELKESGDERIRKELIKVFTNRKELVKNQSFGDITISDILAWLEKQGEQKPADWTEDRRKELSLSLQIQAYLSTASDELYAKGKPIYSEERLEDIHKCMLMWQKLHNAYFYHNPVEWSEEDEKIISDAEVWLDTLCDYLKDSSSAYIPNVRVIISKLKSLKDRVQPQPQWNPSDEQMKTIEHICDGNYNVDLDILDSIYRDFKKLRKK